MSNAPLPNSNLQFDAEGVEFISDVSVAHGVLRCFIRCDTGFGYADWYAFLKHVKHDGRDILHEVGPAEITRLEDFACEALKQKNQE